MFNKGKARAKERGEVTCGDANFPAAVSGHEGDVAREEQEGQVVERDVASLDDVASDGVDEDRRDRRPARPEDRQEVLVQLQYHVPYLRRDTQHTITSVWFSFF